MITNSQVDTLLPAWDVGGEHQIEIAAPAAVVYQQVLALDLSRSWSVRQLFRLRGLPSRSMTIGGLQAIRFALLLDDPPRELVLGLIGQFWTPSGKLRATNREDFMTFAEPGYAKAVWSFHVHESRNGVVLTTHTRVLCLDAASRRRFRWYWRVIRPFSGWIRRRALLVIKTESERYAA